MIWAIMEKLIELLNEYEKEKKSWFTWRSIDSYDNCVYGVDCDWETEITMYSDLYSKQYWFIKRLIKENKIDIERLHKIVDYRLEIKENYVNAHDYNSDCLLMLLAISDTPIEFLISILK